MLKLIANLLFSIILNCYKRYETAYNVRLAPDVFLKLLRSKASKLHLRNVIVGRGVNLMEGCSFFNAPELFGNVILNRYVSVSGPATRICAEVNKVIIGSFSSIASNVVIQEFYHDFNLPTTFNIDNNFYADKGAKPAVFSKGNIEIGEDVWIGSNSVILSGVNIGRGAIIGAGSVVTKHVEPYSIVAGNPAVKIRMRFSQETITYLEGLRWWDWDDNTMRENRQFFKKSLND